MSDAQVVYERNETFDERSGPCGSARVGVRFSDRVLWLGLSYWPSDQGVHDKFATDERLAQEIVRRWNAAP